MKHPRIVKALLMLLIPLYTTYPPGGVEGGEYILIDLGTLDGPESYAFDLNDNRQVTGNSSVTDTVRHAFIWDELNGMQDIGTLGGMESDGHGINNLGEVAGWSDITDDFPNHAMYFDGVLMHDLGTLGGPTSVAQGINDNGQITGAAQLEDGKRHAFLVENGGMLDLGTLGGTSSNGLGINKHGQIVGFSWLTDDVGYHAFIWDKNDGMQSLVTLGGNLSRAYGINSHGQVTGESEYSDITTNKHAFLWDEVNGMQDIGVLSGAESSTAFAINDHAQVTGSSEGRAFIWDEANGIQDLCEVTDCIANGWSGLTRGMGINSHGDIAGDGVIGGVSHAFLALAPDEFVVEIDVLPKKDVNKINLNSKGSIQVVILSTDYFHAYNEVEPASVRFGPANAVAIRYKVKDTNRDSLPDMVFYFKIRETGIECGDSEATLSGETYEGAAFEGTDTIVTTGCGE